MESNTKTIKTSKVNFYRNINCNEPSVSCLEKGDKVTILKKKERSVIRGRTAYHANTH